MLLADDLHEHPLRPAAVELAVEDLLPRAEVELPLRDRDHDLAAHHLPLHVGVGVVLAGAVVVVDVRIGIERGELLELDAEVVMQSAVVVVDEEAPRDVHRVHEARSVTPCRSSLAGVVDAVRR